jgi:hypothetical protein
MSAALPVLMLLTSLVPAVVTFFLEQNSHRLRNGLNLGGALLKLVLVIWMLLAVAGGAAYEATLPLAPGLVILLRVDALALLFVSLSATLWLLTTIYAIAYFGTKAELSRFFGFFSLCVAATTGLALSGSLISFFIFFELLTLSTWPLVAHKQDRPSLAAARLYMAYALPGSAALLWAMQEKCVTVGQETFPLPKPFFVLATQNPIEQEGTYPLPEAQKDRFLFLIKVDYPSREEEREVIARTTGGVQEEIQPVITAEELQAAQELARKVPVPDHVTDFVLDLVRATRPAEPDALPYVKEMLSWGAGPRASQMLVLAGKVRALLQGRTHVTLDDIEALAAPALRHRLVPTFHAEAEGVTVDHIVAELIRRVRKDEAKVL